jgi:hypothetical protein
VHIETIEALFSGSRQFRRIMRWVCWQRFGRGGRGEQAGDECCLTGGMGEHRQAAVQAGEATGSSRRVGAQNVTGTVKINGVGATETAGRHGGKVRM